VVAASDWASEVCCSQSLESKESLELSPEYFGKLKVENDREEVDFLLMESLSAADAEDIVTW